MLLFILKSSACLLVFYAFYKLFLEKENMHVFKRYYLLGALAASILIPFITFTTYVDGSPVDAQIMNDNVTMLPAESSFFETIDWSAVLWSFYVLGLTVFGFRFIKNLYEIDTKIRRNPKRKHYKYTDVLLKDLVVPHTFFNYIFFNKNKYEAQEIPQEVFWHEQTHAKQKHSIDVLLIELLQTVFWFNPIFYAYNHLVKLNHEFLADQGVLEKGIEARAYQETILTFSSKSHHPNLANAINYSLIKKRFTVMKTQTTKTAIWLRSLVLLPLLALLLFSFSNKETVIKDANDISINNDDYTARSITVEILDTNTFKIDGLSATRNSFTSVLNQLHQDITPEIRKNIINVHLNSSSEITNEEVWFVYNAIQDYGYHRLVTKNQEVIREKGNTPFAIETKTGGMKIERSVKESNVQEGATKAQIKEYNALAKKLHYNEDRKDNYIVEKKDIERIKYLYGLMTDAQKKNASPFPNIAPPPPPPPAPTSIKVREVPPPPPPPVPADATPAQKAKYNEAVKSYKIAVEKAAKAETDMIRVREINDAEKVKLRQIKEEYARERKANADQRQAEMKLYKEQLAKQRQLQAKERELLREQYRSQNMGEKEAKALKEKMVKLEKKQAMADKKRVEVLEKRLKESEKRQLKVEEKRRAAVAERVKRSEQRQVRAVEERKAAVAERVKRQEERVARELREVPPPPPPKSPLDHVVDMAKKGATFYIDNKKVSSDKAIDFIKNNDNISISTKDSNASTPKVYITKNN